MNRGYTVDDAARVLGIPTERVWDLVARGVLTGARGDDGTWRVQLGDRAAEGETPQPSRADEREQRAAADAPPAARGELSPFRELLTEFRNLTERYGQALLALGEARGEVVNLTSRVDALEARIELRLPYGGPPAGAWPATGSADESATAVVPPPAAILAEDRAAVDDVSAADVAGEPPITADEPPVRDDLPLVADEPGAWETDVPETAADRSPEMAEIAPELGAVAAVADMPAGEAAPPAEGAAEPLTQADAGPEGDTTEAEAAAGIADGAVEPALPAAVSDDASASEEAPPGAEGVADEIQVAWDGTPIPQRERPDADVAGSAGGSPAAEGAAEDDAEPASETEPAAAVPTSEMPDLPAVDLPEIDLPSLDDEFETIDDLLVLAGDEGDDIDRADAADELEAPAQPAGHDAMAAGAVERAGDGPEPPGTADATADASGDDADRGLRRRSHRLGSEIAAALARANDPSPTELPTGIEQAAAAAAAAASAASAAGDETAASDAEPGAMPFMTSESVPSTAASAAAGADAEADGASQAPEPAPAPEAEASAWAAWPRPGAERRTEAGEEALLWIGGEPGDAADEDYAAEMEVGSAGWQAGEAPSREDAAPPTASRAVPQAEDDLAGDPYPDQDELIEALGWEENEVEAIRALLATQSAPAASWPAAEDGTDAPSEAAVGSPAHDAVPDDASPEVADATDREPEQPAPAEAWPAADRGPDRPASQPAAFELPGAADLDAALAALRRLTSEDAAADDAARATMAQAGGEGEREDGERAGLEPDAARDGEEGSAPRPVPAPRPTPSPRPLTTRDATWNRRSPAANAYRRLRRFLGG